MDDCLTNEDPMTPANQWVNESGRYNSAALEIRTVNGFYPCPRPVQEGLSKLQPVSLNDNYILVITRFESSRYKYATIDVYRCFTYLSSIHHHV